MKLSGVLGLTCIAGLVASAHALSSQRQPGRTRELPAGIVAVAPAERGPRHVLVAEKSTQTLYVYAFDSHETSLVRVYPCTTGKVKGDKAREGDLKTPEGVYWFLRRISGDELPPLYGAGALVMDYPNQFDRGEGKTGSGIWLHGVETNERAYVANDTRGCVAIRNDHFADLGRLVGLRDTPILIVESIDFKDVGELAREGHFIGDFIEAWRRAWEARDFSGYMESYARDFRAGGLDRDGWARHKRDIARLEGERRVAIGDMTILREKSRVWVTFRQEYARATHQDVGMKTLFLTGSDQAWHIVGEGWRELGEPFRLLSPSELPPQSVIASAETRRPALPAEQQEEAIAASAEAAGEEAAVSAVPEGADSSFLATSLAIDAATQEPPATAEVEPAGPTPRPTLVARAAPPRIAKGPFRLMPPWARTDGENIVVATQLLNSTPSMSRSGVVVFKLKSAASPEREIAREAFTVRQGRDLEVRVPAREVPCDIVVLVLDESGKVSWDQDLGIVMETRP